MKLNHIRHVFFDLDHTLWDFDRNSALTFRKIFELNQIDVKIEDFIKIYEPLNLKYWKLYREDRISRENLRYKRLKDTFNSLEVEIEDEVVNKLSIDYIKFLTTFNHLFVGTVELLNYLSVNYKLHIITNGFGEAQTRKLSNSQLIDYFQTITNSEMVGVKKPNPRIFYYALEKAKAGKEESIMIGDSLEADIEGALNVGMDAIFFNFRKKSVNYGIKNVESLEDIKLFL